MTTLLPLPAVPISTRIATIEDLPFIDDLQKKNRKALGFLPTQALLGKIEKREVLIAVGAALASPADRSARMDDVDRSREAGDGTRDAGDASVAPTQRLGYVIFTDRYLKRDELGAIFQMCVIPEARGKLVAATLLKAVFDRSAYGCKLFCCWCAQDLDANKFWEAMGFVPIAFRSGGKGKGRGARKSPGGPSSLAPDPSPLAPRIHIYWQKRIRAGDVTTPWWFPSATSGGSLSADRLVFPIPPGVRWEDEMPTVLPSSSEEARLIESTQTKKPRDRTIAPQAIVPMEKEPPIRAGRLTSFHSAPKIVPPTMTTPVRKPKAKYDPKHVAAARELRDRYLEQVNAAHPSANPMAALPGKYDVSRSIAQDVTIDVTPSPTALLPAA